MFDTGYYDDQTMQIVHDALSDAGIDAKKSTEIVSAMQSRGILFRERIRRASEIPFLVGDIVDKPGGAYNFKSTVASVFENSVGDIRLVAESLVIPKMLHIFSPAQMRLVTDGCHNHQPKQHRDGKPPWCANCGLTATYEEPTSRLTREDIGEK